MGVAEGALDRLLREMQAEGRVVCLVSQHKKQETWVKTFSGAAAGAVGALTREAVLEALPLQGLSGMFAKVFWSDMLCCVLCAVCVV